MARSGGKGERGPPGGGSKAPLQLKQARWLPTFEVHEGNPTPATTAESGVHDANEDNVRGGGRRRGGLSRATQRLASLVVVAVVVVGADNGQQWGVTSASWRCVFPALDCLAGSAGAPLYFNPSPASEQTVHRRRRPSPPVLRHPLPNFAVPAALPRPQPLSPPQRTAEAVGVRPPRPTAVTAGSGRRRFHTTTRPTVAHDLRHQPRFVRCPRRGARQSAAAHYEWGAPPPTAGLHEGSGGETVLSWGADNPHGTRHRRLSPSSCISGYGGVCQTFTSLLPPPILPSRPPRLPHCLFHVLVVAEQSPAGGGRCHRCGRAPPRLVRLPHGARALPRDFLFLFFSFPFSPFQCAKRRGRDYPSFRRPPSEWRVLPLQGLLGAAVCSSSRFSPHLARRATPRYTARHLPAGPPPRSHLFCPQPR